MQKIAIVVIALIAALGLYMFLTPPSPSHNTPTEVDSKTAADARAHIKQLTEASASQAIPVNQADNFVTADQMLTLPKTVGNTQAAVTTESIASSSDASTYGVDLGLGTKSGSNSKSNGVLTATNRMRLQELLNDPRNKGRIFYIHSVNKLDRQGLWGIMQRGLTETFAKGIKVDHRLLKAQIPSDADERLWDDSSSFLGNMLNRKVNETLVYNYQQGLLGADPNVIQPGQQLVIVRFSEDELIQIYNHFAHPQQ